MTWFEIKFSRKKMHIVSRLNSSWIKFQSLVDGGFFLSFYFFQNDLLFASPKWPLRQIRHGVYFVCSIETSSRMLFSPRQCCLLHLKLLFLWWCLLADISKHSSLWDAFRWLASTVSCIHSRICATQLSICHCESAAAQSKLHFQVLDPVSILIPMTKKQILKLN